MTSVDLVEFQGFGLPRILSIFLNSIKQNLKKKLKNKTLQQSLEKQIAE